MIRDRRKLEFWDYLTSEKNQSRPRGITVHRLAVIKPLAIASDLWINVITTTAEDSNLTAREFYQTADPAATQSRTMFWKAVRDIISQQEEIERTKNKRRKSY